MKNVVRPTRHLFFFRGVDRIYVFYKNLCFYHIWFAAFTVLYGFRNPLILSISQLYRFDVFTAFRNTAPEIDWQLIVQVYTSSTFLWNFGDETTNEFRLLVDCDTFYIYLYWHFQKIIQIRMYFIFYLLPFVFTVKKLFRLL